MNSKTKYCAILSCIVVVLALFSSFIFSQNSDTGHTTIITFTFSPDNVIIANKGNYSIGAFTYNITFTGWSQMNGALAGYLYTVFPVRENEIFSFSSSCDGLESSQRIIAPASGDMKKEAKEYLFGIYGLHLESIIGGTLTQISAIWGQPSTTYDLQFSDEYGWYVSLNV